MDPTSWARDNRALAAASRREWAALHRALSEFGADIDLVPAAAGPARSRVHRERCGGARSARRCWRVSVTRERRREEVHFEAAFRVAAGARPHRCRWQAARTMSCSKAPATASGTTRASCSGWDYGPRSDAAARDAVEDQFGVTRSRSSLRTRASITWTRRSARCPRGEVMYVPGAFTPLGPSRDPRAGRAGSSASRSRTRTRAGSPPTPSASATRW